ncbi:MAG: tRNA (adenine-N1)-methyltransferase [Pseudodesulfovibrio sp.]|nr:tRNA (adenine-N1)-methyltransferase [Pseudodesulfovibrio sp.]
MIEPGQLILLISHKGKRYLRKIEAGGEVHTHDGKLLMDDIAEAGFGQYVKTHLDRAYLVLKPTLHDLIKGVKRQTQIMYPKEIGYLMMKLGIGPGSTVIESGTGSGGLTTALAWFVGDTGKVFTYERRAEFFKLAGKNLERVGLAHRVEQVNQNIEDGFLHSGADALFLDVRTPWEYLPSVPCTVIPGAMCGFLLPTVNQVSELLRGLEDGPFADLEVLEILIRHWKPVPDRLRPDDRMVAHTGFLVFARYMEQPKATPKPVVEASVETESVPETEPESEIQQLEEE